MSGHVELNNSDHDSPYTTTCAAGYVCIKSTLDNDMQLPKQSIRHTDDAYAILGWIYVSDTQNHLHLRCTHSPYQDGRAPNA